LCVREPAFFSKRAETGLGQPGRHVAPSRHIRNLRRGAMSR
jgi:hypothetical protein